MMVSVLNVIRHGHANYGKDPLRDLTEEGLLVVERLRPVVDRLAISAPMFVSPAVRAQETARELFGDLDPKTLCEEIRPTWLNEEEQKTLIRVHGHRGEDHWYAHWHDLDPFHRVNMALSQQMHPFLERVRALPDREVTIVGHLETLRCLCVALRVPIKKVIVPHPASVTTILFRTNRIRYATPDTVRWVRY